MTQGPATPEQVREALRRSADALEQRAEEVSVDIARVLHRGVVLQDDPRSLRDSARTSQEILRAFVRTVRRGEPVHGVEPPPDALAVARALARSGEGLRQLLRLCHLGHGAVLNAWEADIAALDADADVIVSATRAAHHVTFAWVDAFSGRLSDEYERERDRLVRTGEAQRARTIRALLAGDTKDPAAAGRTLGYELARHHTALVLWTDEGRGEAGALLESAAHDAARALDAGRPLLLPVAGTVTWAWVGRAHVPPGEVVREVLGGRRQDGVSIAVGEPADGAAGFRRSHQDAHDAFRVALLGSRRAGTITAFESVPIAAMLVGDLDRTRRFVQAQLGALATDDDDHARLRATLRVYLDEQGSRQATAERLGIHANTVGNRVRACHETLGEDLHGRRQEVHLALLLAAQLGSGVLS